MNNIDQNILERYARNTCTEKEISDIKNWLGSSQNQSIVPKDLFEAKSSTWIKIESTTSKQNIFMTNKTLLITLTISTIIGLVILLNY